MEDLNPAAATPVARHSACKRPPLGTDISLTRRATLNARRMRQMMRLPGFTPMPNKRLNKAMAERFAVELSQEMEHRQAMIEAGIPVADEPDVGEIQKRAVLAVAKTLPATSPSKLFRRRLSKSDSPIYRGVGGAGPRRQAEMGL